MSCLTSDFITRAMSLSPSLHWASHTDYTQHIFILSFSHMSHVRLGMSQCNYCRLIVVLKLGMSSEDQNKQEKKITHKKKPWIQPKHKFCEHNIRTKVNMWFPLYTWVDPLLLWSWKVSIFALYRRLQSSTDLWEVQNTQGARALLYFNRYHHIFSPFLPWFWSQDGMRC